MTTVTLPQAAPNEQRTEHPHVTRVEGVWNGAPILRGTRIPVHLIAQMYRAGDIVDDILRSYPQLSATAVHDAISYYLDHRVEIEQEIVAHGIENVLTQTGAQMDERGFISFPATPDHG